MGPLYCCILLLTILITNIPLRGLWSFLVIILLVVVDGVFAVADGSAVMPIGDTASIYVDQELPNWNMKVGASVEWAGTLSDPVPTATTSETTNPTPW